jgi:hypothetical protein
VLVRCDGKVSEESFSSLAHTVETIGWLGRFTHPRVYFALVRWRRPGINRVTIQGAVEFRNQGGKSIGVRLDLDCRNQMSYSLVVFDAGVHGSASRSLRT